MVSGKVIGGQNPVSGATVSVYQVGTTGYGMGSAQLGTSVVTGTDGTFSFPAANYTCPYSNTPTYIVATGGNPGSGTNANIALMALFGSCSSGKNATVIVNEVTTAAAVTAVGQFMNPTLGAGVTSVSMIKVSYGSSGGYPTLILSVPDVGAYQHGTGYGVTMTAPYGIGVDGSGNVWVSNASCVSTTSTACSVTSFTLSEMVGAAAPMTTPEAAEGLGVHMPTN